VDCPGAGRRAAPVTGGTRAQTAARAGGGRGSRRANGAVIEIPGPVKDYKSARCWWHVLKASRSKLKGRFVSIMGPSGSGKSTPMNILGCLDKPTSGTYTLDGISVGNLDSRRNWRKSGTKDRGCFQQSLTCWPETSATENVELAHDVQPMLPPASGRARMKALLRGVGGTRGTPAEPAFRGSRARGHRAVAGERSQHHPGGEPTGALDSRTSIEIMASFFAG